MNEESDALNEAEIAINLAITYDARMDALQRLWDRARAYNQSENDWYGEGL